MGLPSRFFEKKFVKDEKGDNITPFDGSSMVERPHSIRGGPGSTPGRCSSIFGIWREVLGRNV